MKTIIYLFFFGLAIIIFSCQEESNSRENINTDISGKLINNSDCKNLKLANGEITVSDSLSCVEYSFNSLNNKLNIKHVNAGFNCCPEELYCEISLNNDTIIIEEFEKEAQCDCNCLYDLDIEISGVTKQKYFIRFIEPYVGEQQKIEFEIDLINSEDSSYCVVRKDYPWGIY